MPELPEVQTIVDDLKKKVVGRRIVNAWSDWQKMIKKPKNFTAFKRDIAGKKILSVERKGKNIIFNLSKNKILLIHQKLTGHLLVGKWKSVNGNWKSLIKGLLEEKVNDYIHLILSLDNGKMIALSDLRKFAKVILDNKDCIENLPDLKDLGPEPLDKNFKFEKFKDLMKKETRSIKQVLMDQEVIAGIGNIYSDEILWESKISPFKKTNRLLEVELKKLYLAIKGILSYALKLRGTSISDYRDTAGEKGKYSDVRMVYQRGGEPCPRCGAKIVRIKMGGRSAHYCSICQK